MDSNASLHDVRKFLGHANIAQTSTYLNSTTTRMREALERMEASAEPSGDVAESRQVSELR